MMTNNSRTMGTFRFECNDAIEEAITNAASVLTDEYFTQNGMRDIAEDHTDEWYELQETIRETIYNKTYDRMNEHFLQ